MPYFLMFLKVALNRLRMKDFKRPGNSQLQHPQKLVVIELILVAFMILTVGVALQHPYLRTCRLISIKL